MHPAIEMSDEEVDAFLDRKRTLRVASIGPDGYPHNVPVGYVYDGGLVYFPSDEASQKVANLRRDPRLCCVVDEGTAGKDYDTLKGVMLRGRATVYDEDEHPSMTHGAVMERIFRGEIEDEERYERVDRVVVEVDPEDVVAWDFGKV